jgi:hypothetical protein
MFDHGRIQIGFKYYSLNEWDLMGVLGNHRDNALEAARSMFSFSSKPKEDPAKTAKERVSAFRRRRRWPGEECGCCRPRRCRSSCDRASARSRGISGVSGAAAKRGGWGRLNVLRSD